MSDRRSIALGFLKAPLFVAALVFGMAWMIVTVPILVVCLAVTLLPAEVLLALSPFVGLVWPPAGRWMASWMDPAGDALEACMDTLWAPLGRAFDAL